MTWVSDEYVKEKVRLHILSSFNGCLCLWCGNTHSYNRSIRTYTMLLMSSDTKPSRATGTQRILLWLGSHERNSAKISFQHRQDAWLLWRRDWECQFSNFLHATRCWISSYQLGCRQGWRWSCGKLQSGADWRRADVEFDVNWLHPVEEAILAPSNA